jgi:hypothetical protein
VFFDVHFFARRALCSLKSAHFLTPHLFQTFQSSMPAKGDAFLAKKKSTPSDAQRTTFLFFS